MAKQKSQPSNKPNAAQTQNQAPTGAQGDAQAQNPTAEAQNPPKAKSAKTDAIEGIFVRTAPGAAGFRRAGFAFNAAGYGIALDALTDEQLAAIEAEPRLITERCTFSDDAAALRR